jgi:hydrogenase maturation protease
MLEDGSKRTLILGLGNELAGDDAIGLVAARALRERLGDSIDVEESAASGMALLEILAGYDRVLVIDSIKSGRNPPGAISELTLAEVGRVVAPSLHHAGLPELAAVAERLGLFFPADTRVLAVEVVDPYTIGATLSEPVANALDEIVKRTLDQVERWTTDDSTGNRNSLSRRE